VADSSSADATRIDRKLAYRRSWIALRSFDALIEARQVGVASWPRPAWYFCRGSLY
jgi:hypothetical protein